ncbi:hypothetical protein [Rhodoferax lithotrophicus]|uniref:hypothetical protein n=1 Tax=Rhodoferax lithotrophicus TaxID=2798804 RepID=UPI001CC7FA46|nr:hypothetical protein [Rhodoferax sp. MIZ03]
MRDFSNYVINGSTPCAWFINLATHAHSVSIIFWKLGKVAALRAHAAFENSCVTGGAKFVAFVDAPNFGYIFAAFVTHLKIMCLLCHRCAMSSFRCNLAIIRFT